MIRWGLLACGIGIYAAGLVASAPASLVDAGLRRISEGKLRLVDAKGTLWSGVGRVEMRDPAGRAAAAKSLAWGLRPESLLRGRIVADLELEHSGKAFAVSLSPGRIDLADAEIGLPATVLGLGLPRLAPLGLTGDIALHVASLSIDGRQVRGKGKLQWRDAGSTFTPVAPLGNYELNFDGDGATARVVLRTLQGPLQLDGAGSWAIGAPPDFLAVAQVAPQQFEQLAPLLRLIAVERGAGRFELRLGH